jgi:hypothetical protein
VPCSVFVQKVNCLGCGGALPRSAAKNMLGYFVFSYRHRCTASLDGCVPHRLFKASHAHGPAVAKGDYDSRVDMTGRRPNMVTMGEG